MEARTALFCLGPAGKGALEIRQVPRRHPAADEVEIAVEAASVNPIDVRRAEGYGLRLLSLLGAGKFPLVLGNDFAGTIATTGARVSVLAVLDHRELFGLLGLKILAVILGGTIAVMAVTGLIVDLCWR
jgi:NADPH:quinone reductase-like Zn-dependent oxidoreductase